MEASYVRLYVTKRAYAANDGAYVVQLSELAAFGTLSANNFAVDVSKSALELTVGESDSVKVTVTAVDELDHSVSWESADPAIASVDENGVITGQSRWQHDDHRDRCKLRKKRKRREHQKRDLRYGR